MAPRVRLVSVRALDEGEGLPAALDRLERAGIVAVVAAGNDGGDACRHLPANIASAVTVGAAVLYLSAHPLTPSP